MFILDGYNEIEKPDRNFYVDNKFGSWKAGCNHEQACQSLISNLTAGATVAPRPIVFSPDGQMIACGGISEPPNIALWSLLPQDKILHEFTTGGFTGLSFSPDGTILACTGSDKTLRLFSVTVRGLYHVFKVNALDGCLAFFQRAS